MFRLRRFLLKLAWLADFAAGIPWKLCMLAWRGVDVSLLADVKLRQRRRLRFGRGVVVGRGCVLSACGGAIELGDGVVIQDGTQLLNYGGRGISIGAGTNINRDCLLYGHGGLRVGENCLVAARCIFIPANHRFDDPAVPIARQGETRLGIRIGNDVWLGVGVTVLDGVTIGDGCVVGAGSVVTRSIPAGSVAAGVPARIVKSRPSAAGTQSPAQTPSEAICF